LPDQERFSGNRPVHRVAHDHEGTPVDQPGGKFVWDVWGHVVAPWVWSLGDFSPSAPIFRIAPNRFTGHASGGLPAAARQHNRTNRDHVHAADGFSDQGLVERIIEAVAPC
jgi:hypothetical protein